MAAPRTLVPGWVILVPLCLGTGVFLGQNLQLRQQQRVWNGPGEGNEALPAVMGRLPSLAPIVQRVAPSVVTVGVKVRGEDPKREKNRSGSGFVVNSSGIIVTNQHLVADARVVTVELPGERPRVVEVAGEDPITDLAVLRMRNPPAGLQALELGPSEAMRAGDFVVTVGNPLEFSQTVSFGVVSYVGRHLEHYDLHVSNNFLQFSAPVNKGSSGSPVLDLEGRVVGVITQSAEQAANISFAIPSRTLKWILDELDQSRDGRVHRGYLGIRFRPRPGTDENGRPLEGALVTGVTENAPAHKSGLRIDDVVLYCDERKVGEVDQLHEWITRARPGSPMRLVVMRDERVLEPIEVLVGEVRPPGART